jgi:hypothetical protein
VVAVAALVVGASAFMTTMGMAIRNDSSSSNNSSNDCNNTNHEWHKINK